MKDYIYLDNAATTKIDQKVLNAMIPFLMEEYGNPSSNYFLGENAKEAVNQARKSVAKLINSSPENILFTGCATESNNAAILSMTKKYPTKKHIITSNIEHPSIMNTLHRLEKEGYKISYIKVNKSGIINIENILSEITSNTLMVTIMYVNNELGSINPIKELGRKLKELDITFHTDAVQAMGKIKIDINELNIDFLSLSGHKIHAPKGVGALYIKDLDNFKPLITGGHQEEDRRGGTENVASIVGLGETTKIINKELKTNVKYVENLKEDFEHKLQQIYGIIINGKKSQRVCTISSVSFSDIESIEIYQHLLSSKIMLSMGSACNAATLKLSHVMEAINMPTGAIRFSFSKYNTIEEVDYVVNRMREIIENIREVKNRRKK